MESKSIIFVLTIRALVAFIFHTTFVIAVYVVFFVMDYFGAGGRPASSISVGEMYWYTLFYLPWTFISWVLVFFVRVKIVGLPLPYLRKKEN